MKQIVRNFKNLSYSHEENAVRNATTNDELEVTQEALEEVRHCAMESTGDAYSKFYDLFMKRLTDFKHIHHVHKGIKNVKEKRQKKIRGQTKVSCLCSLKPTKRSFVFLL